MKGDLLTFFSLPARRRERERKRERERERESPSVGHTRVEYLRNTKSQQIDIKIGILVYILREVVFRDKYTG